MKVIITISFLLLSVSSYSQRINKYFRVEKPGMTIDISMESCWNGPYVSKYKNGTVRAEGNFKDNVRTGIWTVYDSTGKKIHQRNYKDDHLSFVTLFPEPETKGPASLFDTSVYHAVKGKDGYIPYFEIKERMIAYSTRLWRTMPSTEKNKPFFDKNALYNAVFNFVTDTNNLAYCSSDEDFAKQVFPSTLKKYSLKNYNVIEWKIKEDNFYDVERNVSETRIIGICPVGVDKKTNDTTDLYWIYFPYIRKPLSEVKTKVKNEKGESQTLDDLFFFRNFSVLVYKQSNINGRELKDYCKTMAELMAERAQIETDLIEMEHEIWLGNLPR